MSKPIPIELNLHRYSKVLEVKYPDEVSFNLPCEYLRVFSPSAEVQGHGPGQQVLQVGKEDVNIEKIELIGNYAICLHFDDGHNSGIYSWDYIYNLSQNHQQNWQEYLEELAQAGYSRKQLPS
ncbi:1-(5-phosphoribosyl)-5-[(5-phosphoribosylamino)methylideneamino] imidazole-4-carboxamide isomerase [Achromatium sp. WMS2]|nr:1-(5-phosphoribosyl)-5-[(5-phosphoribosylamino)methylideneamino] imidazole-4-carboxamide isomerase [Achromatium sp. WMS2]